jgi:hypothetical protein
MKMAKKLAAQKYNPETATERQLEIDQAIDDMTQNNKSRKVISHYQYIEMLMKDFRLSKKAATQELARFTEWEAENVI